MNSTYPTRLVMQNHSQPGWKRTGITTGTCAQAAVKGACLMLADRKTVDGVEVETPSGVRLNIDLIDQELGDGFARCAVIKDSGDDPDVTDNAKICAEVRLSKIKGIAIRGGEGVGRVTKPGLAVAIGDWAINPTPRAMILKEASRFLPEGKGLEVIISVPGGKELAKKTYNPRLGIVGGISIIGTTGIVEPKSLDAYKASLALELNVLKSEGRDRVVFVLGYVGERFAKKELRVSDDSIIKIGDHVGFMLEEAANRGIEEALLIGHIGKLIKVAAGQFNTHFSFGDNRIASIARYAASCGADKNIIQDIMRQETAEATIKILKEKALTKVFREITNDVSKKAMELVGNRIKVEVIILSLDGEIL